MKRNYREAIKTLGKEKIEIRYSFLLDKINNFISSRDLEELVNIDEKIVQELVVDYYSDINRIKDFYKIGGAKDVISYLGFWIILKKPLNLKNKKEELKINIYLQQVNEWLAFHLVLDHAIYKSDYSLFYDI
jgi:hypothetical protein